MTAQRFLFGHRIYARTGLVWLSSAFEEETHLRSGCGFWHNCSHSNIMYKVLADKLVHIGRVLQSLQMNALADIAPQTILNNHARQQLLGQLTSIKQDCDAMRLTCSADLLDWVIRDYSENPHNHGQARSTLESFSTAFQQELHRQLFVYVESDKAKAFRSVDDAIRDAPFGLDTWQAFPHALRDMALAGNCFAFGFYDACVFHLMRVLEKGLSAIATVFAVPFQFENWNTVIQQLESKIRKIDPAAGPDWRTKQKFYSEAACEFMFFKAAWRNHVMHGRDEYDEERAKNIYDHVGVFMRHLAQGGLTE
jgi:hypothetical protein